MAVRFRCAVSPGVGSVFEFTIPAKNAQLNRSPCRKIGRLCATPFLWSLWTTTPVAWSCFPRALEQPGLNIYTASDPEAALDLIFDKHPHIVLTDLVMPKMTGLELLERVISFDPCH